MAANKVKSLHKLKVEAKAGIRAIMEKNEYDPYGALIAETRNSKCTIHTRIEIHKFLMKYTYSENLPATNDGEAASGKKLTIVID